jgi:gluconate kinase
MLNGEKGSGKTLLAKTLSIEAAKQGIPTIIINNAWTGDAFNKFLQDIEQPCIILFDEFEKVYDADDQEAALTLLDGVFPQKKLFIITCNDKWRVNEHMRNRPGRIYYMLDFTGLAVEFIEEYCNDNLKSKEHIQKICDITSLFDQFNFDMLKALVEEMNRYGETPQEALKMLNAKPEYNNGGKFDIQLFVNGKELDSRNSVDKVWRGNPLTAAIHIEWDPEPDNDDSVWITSVFTPANIKKVDAQEGRFTYSNDRNDVLVLTRQKETYYNYLAY